MYPGVNVRKADNRTAGVWHGYPRRKIWLKDQTFAARRYLRQPLVQQLFCTDPFALGLSFLLLSEFLFKPGNQPISSVYFDFRIISSFISRNIWREETLGFHIAVYGILHRSCGAEADGCFFRCGAGQADGLTAFIGAGGDQRQTCQDACLKGRLSCDFSQHLTGVL